MIDSTHINVIKEKGNGLYQLYLYTKLPPTLDQGQ